MTGTVAPGASPEIPEPHNHGYYRYDMISTAGLTLVDDAALSIAPALRTAQQRLVDEAF